jgi:hypothetical protein
MGAFLFLREVRIQRWERGAETKAPHASSQIFWLSSSEEDGSSQSSGIALGWAEALWCTETLFPPPSCGSRERAREDYIRLFTHVERAVPWICFRRGYIRHDAWRLTGNTPRTALYSRAQLYQVINAGRI